jgi:hypothetical protein
LALRWITYDCLGRSVELSDEAWEHILLEHPDLAGYEWAIKQAIEKPYVLTRELDRSLNYYGRGLLPARHARYVHVLGRLGGTQCDISVHTAWPANAVDPYEEVLC